MSQNETARDTGIMDWFSIFHLISVEKLKKYGKKLFYFLFIVLTIMNIFITLSTTPIKPCILIDKNKPLDDKIILFKDPKDFNINNYLYLYQCPTRIGTNLIGIGIELDKEIIGTYK